MENCMKSLAKPVNGNLENGGLNVSYLYSRGCCHMCPSHRCSSGIHSWGWADKKNKMGFFGVEGQTGKHSRVSMIIVGCGGGNRALGARTVNQRGCKTAWRAQKEFPSRVNIGFYMKELRGVVEEGTP